MKHTLLYSPLLLLLWEPARHIIIYTIGALLLLGTALAALLLVAFAMFAVREGMRWRARAFTLTSGA